MKLGRKKQPVGRQRVRGQEPGVKPAPYSYRTQRAEAEYNTGRKTARQKLKLAKRNWIQFWLQRAGLLVLIVAVVFSTVKILSLSGDPKILPLDEQSNAKTFLRDQTLYQDAARYALAQSVWNKNKVTVDASRVSQSMLKQFPELDSVSLTVPLLANRPSVYIEAARPALILNTGDQYYVVSTSGKALLRAASPEALNQPGLPVLTDQSNLPVTINRQAITTDDVHFIQTVVAQLAAKQISISSLVLPPSASELVVQLTGQAYIVKFNLHSDKAREQAGTLLATLDHLKKQNITPAKYIDVRVDGRAYYQ